MLGAVSRHADFHIVVLPRLLIRRAVTCTSRLRRHLRIFLTCMSRYFVHSVCTWVSIVRHSSLIYSCFSNR